MSNPFVFDINTYHQANMRCRPHPRIMQVPVIVCADGFTMSVQASESHYCNPSADNAWPYASFEVGFISASEDLLLPYGSMTVDEDGHEELSDVFGWVPADVVNDIVFKHGGFNHITHGSN